MRPAPLQTLFVATYALQAHFCSSWKTLFIETPRTSDCNSTLHRTRLIITFTSRALIRSQHQWPCSPSSYKTCSTFPSGRVHLSLRFFCTRAGSWLRRVEFLETVISTMALPQPKVQAPYIPGQKEPADLVDIATSEKQQMSTTAGTDEHEQRGEVRGTVVSGAGLVEAGKGMATEVSESLVSVRVRVMEKLSGLQLPSESLEAVRRTFETGLKGAYTTSRDAVQRTKQSLLVLFPSSLTSSSATQARKVVEEMEKEVLGNSEGSGEEMSGVSGRPKVESASETSPPQFMRAKL